MSPTESRTMSSSHPGSVDHCSCDTSWLDLPTVIRAIFDCTRNVTLQQSLESMGAIVDSPGPVRAVYPTGQGAPIVTVWHDRIEADVDGSLVYRPNTLAAEAGDTAALLASYVGREVYVLLLKRGLDAFAPFRAGSNAPDIVMWTVDAVEDNGFLLRRPKSATVQA